MHAVRNIRLCTKDCLCLYVCPTGATDTETGQIDALTCISGCRACVDACPSHAISLIPNNYPPQQKKTDEVIASLRALAQSKVKQEKIAQQIVSTSNDPIARQFANAVSMSNRLMAEDLLREAGYMLPQSENVKILLKSLLDSEQSKEFPKEAIEYLLEAFEK